MGLDFALEGIDMPMPRWSYSGFNHFRRSLAKHIGITLDDMQGFGGEEDWSPHRDDPLTLLLDHSDCDGELSPEECAKIAPRLRQVVQEIDWGPYPYDLEHGLLLADVMEKAAKLGKPLIFC